MPLTAGSVSNTGITSAQNVPISWDDFNRIAPGDQVTILKGMGLNDQEISTLQSTLQKTEIAQYNEYQAMHAPGAKGGGSGFWGGVVNYLNPANYIPGVGHPHVPNLPADVRTQTIDQPSLADIQQQSGLTDLVSNMTLQGKVQQAKGATDPTAGGMPGYTAENLKEYTQNYLVPALGAINQMLQGDEKQWGSSIDNIMKIGGSGTSQIGNMLKMDLAANIPLYNQMFAGQGAQAIAQPWLDMVSNYMGQQLGAGSKALGVSATNQAILPYLSQIPGYLQSLGIQGGTPATGATATTGTTGGIPAITAPNYASLVPQTPIAGLPGSP